MNIVFYDGSCGLCHWAVRWMAKRDTKNIFFFAPLDGLTAKQKLSLELLPDSMVLLEDDQQLYRSRACFRIAWRLGGPYRLIGWCSFLPNFLLLPTDALYRLIAKTRASTCEVLFKDGRFLP